MKGAYDDDELIEPWQILLQFIYCQISNTRCTKYQIPQIKCLSSRPAIVFAQSIETIC